METIQDLIVQLESHKKDYVYYRKLADAYVDNNQVTEAISVFEQYMLIDTSRSEVYNNLGSLYFILKDFEKSEKYFIDGLQKDPMNLDIICNLRDLYLHAGRMDASLGMVERYADVTKDPNVYKELAETYKKFGNFPKMLEMEQKFYLYSEKA